jgi:aryl-alcohol dehydrogenase-like predicted oxidoreductase
VFVITSVFSCLKELSLFRCAGHRLDRVTPIEEIVLSFKFHIIQPHSNLFVIPIAFQMKALHDVVKAGYVRYIGMSSCYAWECMYFFSFELKLDLTFFIWSVTVNIMQSQ